MPDITSSVENEMDSIEVNKNHGMQEYVQSNYMSLITSHDAAVGQFKTAIPLPDDGKIGVVVMSRSSASYERAEGMLQNEKAYLQFLRDAGFSSVSPLKTYGEVFKVTNEGKEYPAMLVDWIPKATLVDSKDPAAFSILLSGVATGVKIPTQQEAWPMKLPSIIESVSLMDQAAIARAQKISDQLLTKISEFKREMKDKNIKIADLQLMISLDENDNVKLSIIDPVAVLEKPEDGSFYEDVMDRGKKADNNPDFAKFLANTDTMLSNMIQWCHHFNASEDKQQFLKQAFESPVSAAPQKPKPVTGTKLSSASVAQMMLGKASQRSAPSRTTGRPSFLPGQRVFIDERKAEAKVQSAAKPAQAVQNNDVEEHQGVEKSPHRTGH